MVDAEAAVTAAWRHEQTRLVAALTRMTGDLALAEDLAQDALVAALEQWPEGGVPARPGAWLMQVAKRRAVDHYRRADTLRRRTAELTRTTEEAPMPDLVDAVDHIEDDVLRLMFLTCHPVLTPESRAALTLRLVGGLTTGEIARAFLVREPTMAQRLSRAKRTLAEAGASFDLPTGAEREARLADVMAVVYLVFNEGYAATSGPDWMRPELCLEALRLSRMLSSLVPDDPEVWGLEALLELQGSRTAARLDDEGRPVLLEDQDRSRWDQLLIRRGLRALEHAKALGAPVGAYVLQAEIAACHARARRAEDTDWARMAHLYDLLVTVAPSAVVEVNRAVAHGRAHGPEQGLAVLAGVDPHSLAGSPVYDAVRGDLLARAGRSAEAAAAFLAAAAKTSNGSEQQLLRDRAAALTDAPGQRTRENSAAPVSNSGPLDRRQGGNRHHSEDAP
jgi:RNA polymerase sigma factor (sigma-70 family)